MLGRIFFPLILIILGMGPPTKKVSSSAMPRCHYQTCPAVIIGLDECHYRAG